MFAKALTTLIVTIVLFMPSPIVVAESSQTRAHELSVPGVVSAAGPADGAQVDGVQWLKMEAPGLGVMLAAVARPAGSGPFPSVILLHGTHGFAHEYVQLAADLARRGVIAIAPCWFSGGSGAGSRFVTPIPCPAAPPMPAAASPESLRTSGALVQMVRSLPGVQLDRIALFGHSRGGGAALNYVLNGGQVRAVVLNSTGYPDEVAEQVSRLDVPILILHGTADSPTDGGGAVTDVQMARRFESKLRRLGKPVEAMYYEGGTHNGIFVSSRQREDEVRRIAAFLLRHLDN